jgi:hypothetical protein
VEIHTSIFKTNSANIVRELFCPFSDPSLSFVLHVLARHMELFQGGAIYSNGYVGAVKIEIYDSTFQTNSAVNVSERVMVSRTFLNFPPCPGGVTWNYP